MEAAFRAVDLPPPDRETALSVIGLSLEIAIARIAGELHLDKVPAMAEAYRASQIVLRESGSVDPLYPGTLSMLDALSARDDVLLGVATGKAMRGVLHMEESHALTGRFVTRQTADKAPSKPHPGMILQAMEETGIAAEKTVMIGDTSFDMEMARNAGVASIGVSWGYHERDRLHSAGAGVVIDHFDALGDELARLFGWERKVA